jgi:hypothetical protein
MHSGLLSPCWTHAAVMQKLRLPPALGAWTNFTAIVCEGVCSAGHFQKILYNSKCMQKLC